MIVRRALEGTEAAGLAASSIIYSVRAPHGEYSLPGDRLTLLCAWCGTQEISFDGRRVHVDDDTWLPLTSAAIVRIRGTDDAHALTVLFRRGMPEEVLSALSTPDDRLLESGESPPPSSLPFGTHLHMHDRSVTPVLLFIRRHCETGVDDGLWYEEQLSFLLERMLMHHRNVLARARHVPVRRVATQREILRRISLATDFIHSNFERPLTLSDMAGAACLSRHHFLRLFKHIHEVTPHEYLQRKRTTVAARLLRGSDLAVEEIVRRVGFDSRSTLFRALRRFHGTTPRECRRAAEAPAFYTQVWQAGLSANVAGSGWSRSADG